MSYTVRACGAPAVSPVSVLKFGSSVLAGADGFRNAAREIAREVAGGRRVVVVVSAMGDTTNELLSTARDVSESPPEALVGQLLATGEAASVAMLGIALAAEGVHAMGLSPEAFQLSTRGCLTDAEPVTADREALLGPLQTHDVVVVAGFVGRDVSGAPSLLGRGGSDLTALFLGVWLDADEVRLVKDVDGVYEDDPHRNEAATRLPSASWSDVRRVGSRVVQEKALAFAEARGLEFRVAAVGGVGTRVGTRDDVG